MDAAAVRERAGELPREPGVYQFLGPDERTLYVGKAVDLPDRVRSYADPRGRRIAAMVDRAATVEVAVTDTETQALLLEANLIKRHNPRYNVRLKDDKSYPLVELTDHEAPRIGITRDPEPDATVFGPYTEKKRVETVVKALREAFGVRGCSDHKYAGRDRPCLDHDLGLCTAPCTGEISTENYLADVESVTRFLDGETGVLADPLRNAMEEAAAAGNFERAANRRDRLSAVEAFHGGASEAVAGPDGDNDETTDVLGVVVEGETATVARLASEDGKLVDRERRRLDVPESDASEGETGGSEADEGEDTEIAGVLGAFVAQYYAERALPDRLLLPERPDDPELLAWLESENVEVRVPGAGREATLVDLALKNARRGRERDSGTAALADRLGIDRAARIEGFDVSHASGRAAVGSDVAFADGDPEKSGYRRKKLDDENDDYANMRALLSWRAARAVEGRDDRPDPDLLVIDGGEGQLNAAREALADEGWDVPAIGLAKTEERVVTPDGEFDWPDDAPELHLLQRVRDEAHRFAVQYHQTVRDEVSTVLDEVSGIGPQTRTRLLRRFGSIDGVRAASPEELQSVSGIGEKTAETISVRL